MLSTRLFNMLKRIRMKIGEERGATNMLRNERKILESHSTTQEVFNIDINIGIIAIFTLSFLK
jgi:hypothetical protein